MFEQAPYFCEPKDHKFSEHTDGQRIYCTACGYTKSIPNWRNVTAINTLIEESTETYPHQEEKSKRRKKIITT